MKKSKDRSSFSINSSIGSVITGTHAFLAFVTWSGCEKRGVCSLVSAGTLESLLNRS